VLPDLDNEQGALPVAEKLLVSIERPMTLEGQIVATSPSIGISFFPRDGATSDVLIKNADAAMYLAKERGRSNYQFFNERLSEAAHRALTLEAKLRVALENDAFELHYQPQMRVDNGALTGIEALIRWPQEGGASSSRASSSRSRSSAASSCASARGCCARRASRTVNGSSRACRSCRWR
jgi:predicted signal transduction protein with EAL and GGDEF domain